MLMIMIDDVVEEEEEGGEGVFVYLEVWGD
jgi:hypothetical protein